jgi:HTH-type transcriptional regulator/antitoxin HipB
MTQEEVAARAGIAQPTLSNIERGEASVPLSTLLRVLSALDLELVVQPRQSRDLARVWDEDG